MNRIIEKITSGRFILTLIAGGVFATLSLTGQLPPDKVHDIVLVVVYAYFNRQREKNGGQ